jgi:hypothetical protein
VEVEKRSGKTRDRTLVQQKKIAISFHANIVYKLVTYKYRVQTIQSPPLLRLTSVKVGLCSIDTDLANRVPELTYPFFLAFLSSSITSIGASLLVSIPLTEVST